MIKPIMGIKTIVRPIRSELQKIGMLKPLSAPANESHDTLTILKPNEKGILENVAKPNDTPQTHNDVRIVEHRPDGTHEIDINFGKSNNTDSEGGVLQNVLDFISNFF